MLFDKTPLNLPNLISMSRILILPCLVFLAQAEIKSAPSEELADFVATPGKWASLIIAFLGFTDYLDGYLARKYRLESVFGAMLDPLADKLTTLVSFTVLMQLNRLNIWIFLFSLGREFLITSLRAVASSRGVIIKARDTGKYKMTFQFIGAGMLLFWQPLWGVSISAAGTMILYLSVALSAISMFDYLYKFKSTLSEDEAP